MNARRLFAAGLLICTTAAFAADTTTDTTAKRYGTWGVDLSGMDKSVKPGDDFFKYVNGNWVATSKIPADRTSWGAFPMLGELSENRVHGILDKWAADKSLKPGSDEAKVAAIYRTYLDEATVEKLDSKPIQPYLDAIRKATTREDIAAIMGKSARGFGSTFFGAGVGDDAKHPDLYTLYVGQGGLGLPDREFYLQDKFKEQKDRYTKYVTDMLRLAGWDDPEKNAADVVALETKLAEAHWTRSEGRNRDKTYNPMTVSELETYAPGFPWRVSLNAAGLNKVQNLVVRQNTALPKEAKAFAEAPIATLQAWEAFHTVDDAAPLLSKRFVDTQWEFRSHYLNGTQEQRPRWKRAVGAAEGLMGEAVGREYAKQYFPPESKAAMEQLVANLRTALKGRIDNLPWMSPETKKAAQDKLAHFTVKIGYPSQWRDYSGLQIKEGDLVGNAERYAQFDWQRDLQRIGNKVDKLEWGMTPQTVNAYYQSTKNEIVFPAAILQPPFFDPKADPAVNYGGIGSVIGHEITHGFDDQGRKSDGFGVLRDWWTADDAKKFEEQATKLGAMYEAVNFSELPGLHIIGRQTMGENIGDLGGVLTSLDAYHLSLKGQPAPVLDGFTGDQRFFLGFAQVWRSMQRPDALRQQLMTNPHSPGTARAQVPLRNIDAWYQAFDVKEGDAQYVKPEERVRIW
jgi:putative endopeptidase